MAAENVRPDTQIILPGLREHSGELSCDRAAPRHRACCTAKFVHVGQDVGTVCTHLSSVGQGV